MRIWRVSPVQHQRREFIDNNYRQREWEQQHVGRFLRWHQALHYTDQYSRGARVWVSHPEKVWIGASLEEDFKGGIIKLLKEDGERVQVSINSDSELPPLRNPDILIGENDLTSLSYLHEPAVLHNLQVRFEHQNAIYTYCGIVLVAINPYAELPIYNTGTIWAYRGQTMGDIEPHLFAVAEEAYTKLEREQRDQSIIVSGESGAGKTVSAKYAMRYFATVGGSATETQVEKKVLASSPIMEAFGNAKTTRNDNSSRFGKFIEIQFNTQWHIQGGSIRTYLLEKSRVVFQAPDERNYHIFYQMCAARNTLPKLYLDDTIKFNYLNQGGNPIIDGVDDCKQFEETQHALCLLGFNDKEQSDLLRILASILHLGNIEFSSKPDADGGEGSSIDSRDKHLTAFAQLLQINLDEMRCWLTQRKIVSMREVFLKPMTTEEALNARDALAKHIYAELFAWIVVVINKSLQSGIQAHRFIGVLDIYGFETFEINSFEQFCINYANEKLQQQFNQHVFKLEQEEYVKEEIEWKFIDFYDNQPCIDLIETKLGILDLLDEECRVPKGSDSSWVTKLYTKCSKWKHFAKPRFGNQAFVIHHFADNVIYQSTGFLEKNKDTVLEDQINVIKNGEIKLIKKLFNPGEDEPKKLVVPGGKVKILASKPAPVSTSKQHKKTVGSQFRDSLNMLMATLNATTPHYVRCIKPNDNKHSFEYNPVRAVQQLRACGVLETIRISAAGFPSRWSYADFFQRYRVLCRFKDIKRHDMKATCETILVLIKDQDKYKFGKSKIFFRAGQVAYLEKLRAEKLLACCITIQKQVRMFVCRKKYLRLKKTALGIQCYARGILARRKAQYIRQTRAATSIQRHIRGWLHRTRYRRLRQFVTLLQTRIRGFLARQRFTELKRNANAIIIQRYIRGWLARKHYARDLHSIVLAQSAVRRHQARNRFKELKREARSVEHVKKLNKGLENKIISLQQKLEEVYKENNHLKQSQHEVVELRAKIEPMKRLEQEIKRMTTIINEKENEVTQLKGVIEIERAEKVDLVNEREKLDLEHRELNNNKNEEILKLEKQLNELNEKSIQNQRESEIKLQSAVEQMKNMLLMENEQERTAYQNLLRDYHALETHNEDLELEMTRFRGGNTNSTNHGHIRSLSNASTVSVAEELYSNTPDLPDDDTGYGSVRSTATQPQHQRLENIDWQQHQQSTPQPAPREHIKQDTSPDSSTKINEPMDISLIVKLQQRLNEKQRSIVKLERRIEELEKDNSPRDDTRDSFKVQELEIQNAKLRKDLDELRKGFAEGHPESTLKAQLDDLQEELDRQRDESVYLHSVLANQTQGLKNVASRNYGSHVDLINEDGELILAFEAQKKITRQLEDELQQETAKWKIEQNELNHEIKRLREDNERQQRILSANLSATDKTPLSQKEAWMEHELTRVTTDNLELQEKIETLNETLKKLKKQNKLLLKKLKDANLLDTVTGDLMDKSGHVASSYVPSGTSTSTTTPYPSATQTKTVQQTSGAPVIRKKERAIMGMFEYNKEDEGIIVRHLVFDLKPKIALTLLPGLPAYILFMCIRHTDYTNDDEKVRTLLTSTINTIKKVIKKRHDDLDTIVLWLSNTLRLLHNLKQYSGDKTFQAMNTQKQNEHCLRNFDLSEYRQVLSDIAIWIYQALVTHFEEKMQPLIVPGILEHEAIPSFIEKKPGGMRGRASSVSDTGPSVDVKKSLDLLLNEMTRLKRTLGFHGVDPELITQAFKQLFYYICATSLNNLMLRKELCHWGKGMQLRYNLSHLEQWTRDNCLQDSNVLESLQPIIQAAHLLQARKTEEDVQSICDMCNKLTMLQILKILNLYTSADGFEDRITPTFINKVQATLKNRNDTQNQAILLLETKYTFPVRFPFNPSNIRLEDIEVPEVLNLPMLKKI